MKQYKFKNSSQMMNGLGAYLQKTLNDIADVVLEQLKTNIEGSIYSWTTKRYNRTGDVLRSISRTKVSKDNKNQYSVIIYFDVNKIQPEIRDGNTWNAHADFWGNEVSGGDLLNWLDRGTENRFYSHEGYEFMEEIFVWLDIELNYLFKEHIKKYGLKIN